MLRSLAVFTTTAALTLPLLAAQILQITAPADRSIVHPGETVTVKFVTSRDTTFSVLAAMGPWGIALESDIPGQFNVSIPAEACCGTHMITVGGRAKAAEEPVYSSILIDIERRDLPVKLQSESGRALGFENPGSGPLPFLFRAFFGDGSSFDVRESSCITYSSANPVVAKVDNSGRVYPLLPGRTVVSANYRLEGKSVQLTIPVTVDVGAIAASTYSLSFGNQAIGTSTENSIVLTNTTHGPVKILEVKANGGFSESDNCASSSPLKPGGTCTVEVTFTASKTGLQEGSLTILNNSSGQLGISLTGTGH
jgi:hypothetical protein